MSAAAPVDEAVAKPDGTIVDHRGGTESGKHPEAAAGTEAALAARCGRARRLSALGRDWRVGHGVGMGPIGLIGPIGPICPILLCALEAEGPRAVGVGGAAPKLTAGVVALLCR